MKGDLDRAGIASEDEPGHAVDLHALRTTFGTWLMLHGVSEQARCLLVRHGGRNVTERSYTDLSLVDAWRADAGGRSVLPGDKARRNTMCGSEGYGVAILRVVFWRRWPQSSCASQRSWGLLNNTGRLAYLSVKQEKR